MDSGHVFERKSNQFTEEPLSFIVPPTKDCIVTVGLPARGKSYISKKLCRFFNWTGYTTKVFNVGQYRRNSHPKEKSNADFFSSRNPEAKALRNEFATQALEDLIFWLKDDTSRIAIFDATNTERSRRQMIVEKCKQNNIRVFFMESICNDKELVERSILNVKLNSPDYAGVPPEISYHDFKKRISMYEEAYEEISEMSESDCSFIKIYNAGKRYIIHNLQGFFQPRVVYYLMNMHLDIRTIYITRHGESIFNTLGKIGGDSELSPNGVKYAKALGKFITTQRHMGIRMWTSKLKRTIQTSLYIHTKRVEIKALDELEAGLCDGLTYKEIKEKYPDEYRLRQENKFSYRYPRGESYADIVNRLESVILELERQRDILVITHQAVARCILAFFCEIESEKVPYIEVPLNTVFAITPNAYGCDIQRYDFDLTNDDAVITQKTLSKLTVSL